MQRTRLAPDELAHVRFAISPLWETVASLRVLQGRQSAMHAGWVGDAWSRIEAAGFDPGLLFALTPRESFMADLTTPAPPRRLNAFESELAAVASQSEELVRRDVAILLDEAADLAVRTLLAGFRRDPAGLLRHTVADLRTYHALAIAPVWERLRALAQADITWRLEQLASGGTHGLLSALHPRVWMEGPTLCVETMAGSPDLEPGHGLVLVPCAFAWPDIVVYSVAGQAPSISYAPRGVGNLWQVAPSVPGSALGELIGRTRAAALAQLELPLSTGQLASVLDVTPSTVSEHLKVMQRCGLVTSGRRGRMVLYSRTGIGDALVSQEGSTWSQTI